MFSITTFHYSIQKISEQINEVVIERIDCTCVQICFKEKLKSGINNMHAAVILDGCKVAANQVLVTDTNLMHEVRIMLLLIHLSSHSNGFFKF